jgi:hypothetical protein
MLNSRISTKTKLALDVVDVRGGLQPVAVTIYRHQFARLPNYLPFSSERQGRIRPYHGREEPRVQPAASRHEPTEERSRVAFVCCNGLLGSSGPAKDITAAHELSTRVLALRPSSHPAGSTTPNARWIERLALAETSQPRAKKGVLDGESS